jgi:hypothetical protein
MKHEETPEEFAARLDLMLREECEAKRPGDELNYVLFVVEPPGEKKNVEGRITYASNVERKAVLMFLEEFIERNKPARGRGNG